MIKRPNDRHNPQSHVAQMAEYGRGDIDVIRSTIFALIRKLHNGGFPICGVLYGDRQRNMTLSFESDSRLTVG